MATKLTFGFAKTAEENKKEENENNVSVNEIEIKDKKIESVADIFRSDIEEMVKESEEENSVMDDSSKEKDIAVLKENFLSHEGEVFETKEVELEKLDLGFLKDKTKNQEEKEENTTSEKSEEVEMKEEVDLEEIQKDNIELESEQKNNLASLKEEIKENNVAAEDLIDFKKLNLIIEEIEKYDHARQVREYEGLSNRKKNLDNSIFVLNIQKQQLEKEIQKLQKEIFDETGIDNIEEFAAYVLKSIQENEELLAKYQKEINQKEQEVNAFKEELEKLEQ